MGKGQGKQGTYDLTTRTFGSVLALVADARGNALLSGDRKRIAIGARYLRLAARQAVALAELVDAVAATDRRQGERAQRQLASIDKDIAKFLDVVAIDNKRFADEHGGRMLKGKDAERLLRDLVQSCTAADQSVH